MNMGPAWQKGYTGKNVVVSILDDGIQTNHPDLAHNYVSKHLNVNKSNERVVRICIFHYFQLYVSLFIGPQN